MIAQQILEELTKAYADRDLLALQKKQTVPADVQKVLDEIDAEFAPQEASVNTVIEALEKQVKEIVKADGHTATGGSLQAVFTKGRVTWDSKYLDGYAKAHPEINEYRKVGEPSVAIRRSV